MRLPLLMRMGMAGLIVAAALAWGLPNAALAQGRCETQRQVWADQAVANAISLYSLEWTPF
ncbi:MAG: D-alanyl-D-alanine carboxypeptidase, partial [Pseudomonadota bacterium]